MTTFGYDNGVSRIEKLTTKFRNNPAGVRFSDLERVVLDLGFRLVNVKGSHYVYKKESKLLTVVKPHGGQKCCAMVDVKKVLEFLKKD